jgi:hypothetical protein
MPGKLIGLFSRILFIISFLIFVISFWEKIANMMGLTLILGYYSSWHLLEISAIILLFVIALQLREIKQSLAAK